MDRPPGKSRRYITIVLSIFVALVLATIVVTTLQYWTDKAAPEGLTGEAKDAAPR
ncbi:MAG TPA: hypothetical protein VF649_06875 [Sphingomonas sp.]|jgi:hypothetical protein|uniref:hypothetical protein n=1 Tax=Sphingomonas sp. TaxID=28214 RepID=UPI002ED81169